MKDQVPYGIDPTDLKYQQETGIQFISFSELFTCFDGVYFSFEIDGYSNNKYDVNGDDSEEKTFTIPLDTQSGDIYFTIETYPLNTIPSRCFWDVLTGKQEFQSPTYDF